VSLSQGIQVDTLIHHLGIPPELVGSVTLSRQRLDVPRMLEDGGEVLFVPSDCWRVGRSATDC